MNVSLQFYRPAHQPSCACARFSPLRTGTTLFPKKGSILWLTGLLSVLLLPSTASAQANTQRGATLGGLAGAVAGGLIGDNNGEAGAGAAIGGLIGAVTGGVLGNAADKEQAAYQQQQYYLQQQQQAAAIQTSVTVADVISMSRSGLSDSVIINQIQQRGVQQQLQVPDIISLHQQGVRESVITAMQQAPLGAARATRTPQVVRERIVTPAPVVIEEHYLVPHYSPPRLHYRHGIPVRRRGFHVHF